MLAVAACGERAHAPVPVPAAPDLITRAALFGEAARHDGQLSPRGDRVAFLAPRDGVTNLWVLSVDAMDEARDRTDPDAGRDKRPRLASVPNLADSIRAASIEAAEQERRRWARELHDETLQGLGALRLVLSTARSSGSGERLEEAVDHALEQLDLEIENLRALVTELRPASGAGVSPPPGAARPRLILPSRTASRALMAS